LLAAMSLASKLTGTTYFVGLQASGAVTYPGKGGVGGVGGGSAVLATDPQGNRGFVLGYGYGTTMELLEWVGAWWLGQQLTKTLTVS